MYKILYLINIDEIIVLFLEKRIKWKSKIKIKREFVISVCCKDLKSF